MIWSITNPSGLQIFGLHKCGNYNEGFVDDLEIVLFSTQNGNL